MNKGELVEAVASGSGLDKRQAENAINAFTDAVMAAVKSGDKVAIIGFGTFNPTARKARVGRNPQTGAPVKIAAAKGVRFGPGAAFKSTLNTGGAKKAAPAKKAGAKKATAKKAPAKKAAKSSKKK